MLNKMTKTSSKKTILRARGILNLSLAVLFSLQPSAEAFIGSLQISSIPAAQSVNAVQPSEEMSSISDKAMLQSALSPIDRESVKIQAVITSSNQAVSISTFQNNYRQFARFVFAATENGTRRYQAYELKQGILGRVIETGILSNGEFVRERIYDYKTGTVVLYNAKNIFEKRIYELGDYAEAGRPVQYRGRTAAGDLINIRFFYQSGKVTCVHMKNMTFATYEFENGVLGHLIEVGTARGILKNGQLDAAHLISIAEMSRGGKSLPVYVFHEEDGTQVTRERIGGNAYTLGAMGRVLRFVSTEADLEYFYVEAAAGEAAKVKVLNHLIGESLTFEVMGKDLNEESGRLQGSKDNSRSPLTKAVFNSLPAFFKDSAWSLWTSSESKSLPIYIRLNEEVQIWEKLLRGPPAFNRHLLTPLSSASFVSFFSSFHSTFLSSSRISGVRA